MCRHYVTTGVTCSTRVLAWLGGVRPTNLPVVPQVPARSNAPAQSQQYHTQHSSSTIPFLRYIYQTRQQYDKRCTSRPSDGSTAIRESEQVKRKLAWLVCVELQAARTLTLRSEGRRGISPRREMILPDKIFSFYRRPLSAGRCRLLKSVRPTPLRSLPGCLSFWSSPLEPCPFARFTVRGSRGGTSIFCCKGR